MSINNAKQLDFINNYYLNDTNSTYDSSTSSLSSSSSSLSSNSSKKKQSNNINDLFEKDEEIQSILKQNKSLNPTTLKYLYKLLKFYKLDHYLIDLIENGYTTPIQLNNLILDDFESIVNVSPYDKKKFLKLKIFIKQIVKSIKSKSFSSNNTLNDKINNYLNKNDDFDNFVDINLNNPNDNKLDKHKMLKKDLIISNNTNINNKNQHQMFIKNPNVNNSKTKRIIIPPNSARSISNSARLNTNVGQFTSRSSASTNYNVYKHNKQRAKSTEPLKETRSSSLATSARSISNLDQLISDSKTVSAVQHPNKYSKLANINFTNTNKYFGPKLQKYKNNHQNISNVRLVETNNYNYGVPFHQINSNKINNSKKTNIFYQNNNKKYYFNLVNHQTSKSKLVTNDIFVYARKRPMLDSESSFRDVVTIGTESSSNNSEITNSICINEFKNSVDGTPVLRKNEFKFDRTFDSGFSNEDIFKTSILPFFTSTSNKSNKNDFSCICFGQTGSGKTHTLFGTKQQDGLCVLTAEHILYSNNNGFRLICGFFEIYNGQLFDLVNQNNRLVLREDSNGQLNVVGLVEVEIKSSNDLKRIIEKSQSNRHIGTTSFNKASSRSHAVIQFKVVANNNFTNSSQTANSNTNKLSQIKSKINTGLNNFNSENNKMSKSFRILFVDLAGSERGVDAQNNTQDNRKEGAEINQSLLALKECIRCIDQYCTHAPFRQSKLTRVLKDCFIGCGKTILIATVSPTDDCVSCSLNTLQYANRVRQMSWRSRPNIEQNELTETKKELIHSSSNLSTKITNYAKKSVLSAPIATSSTNSTSKKTNPNNDQDLKSNNQNKILPCKSKQKTSNSSNDANINMIFHPSKINMSSTPIKSLIKANKDTKHDTLMFSNDTPIKGFKLKYMPDTPNHMISQLAERYFSKVNKEEENDLNQRIAPLSNKNEDEESGVESDELNKKTSNNNKNNNKLDNPSSSTNKIKISEKYAQRYRSIYSLDSPTSQTPIIVQTQSEENNKSKNIIKSSSSSSLILIDENLNRLRQKQRELLESKKLSNEIANIENSQVLLSNQNQNIDKTQDPGEAIINLQNNRQLRSYIQTLENKLNNMRNEMNNEQASTNKERAYSTESINSIDSTKEIMESTSKAVSTSLNHNKKVIDNDNDIEKLFMKKSVASYTLYSDEENELKQEDDIFKKSIHHSNSDMLLIKMVNQKNKSDLNQFSPIESINTYNNTNKVNQQLINPIPIRISSSSSSFDSTNNQNKTLDNDQNENAISGDSNKIKLSNSGKIWKSTKILSNEGEQQLSNTKTWSSILMKSQNCLDKKTSNDFRVIDMKNKINNNNWVVNAHEHQLSDLAETFKKEKDLLSCLKESQMGFEEYISQVEQLLSKKADSIRDLQMQISQLKSKNNGIEPNSNINTILTINQTE